MTADSLAGDGVRSVVPSSLLDPLETAGHQLQGASIGVDNAPNAPSPTHFRHSGWSRRREATQSTMAASGVSMSRLRRFERCGSGFWILRNKSERHRFKLCVDLCRDRWCIPCQRARAALISANLSDHLDDRPYRLITLTLRHHDESLKDALDHLYESFKRLRRQKRWKKTVTGGCAFVEVVLGKHDQLWHAHVHIVCEGAFYAHGNLSDDWHLATGDSYIVDIRLVRNRDQVTRYVTKYTTKPSNLDPVSQDCYLLELMTNLGHRRTIIPFGTWTKFKLLSHPSDEGWERYAHSSDLCLCPKRDIGLDATIAQVIALALTDASVREFTIDDIERSPPTIDLTPSPPDSAAHKPEQFLLVPRDSSPA